MQHNGYYTTFLNAYPTSVLSRGFLSVPPVSERRSEGRTGPSLGLYVALMGARRKESLISGEVDHPTHGGTPQVESGGKRKY